MDRSIDDASIESAVEDPPLFPLAGAVLGILVAAVGVLSLLAPLFVAVSLPIGNPLFLVIVGVLLFVGSMVAWNPAIDWS